MDKYDRQLRLWGADGQRRLATTHILLVHASATGSETLKNLVLPGVQRFTILDDHVVTRADVTNNFFVTPASLGQSRAQVVTDLLLEMNADVSGAARHADPLTVLQQEPQFLDQFQLVVATQVMDARAWALLGAQCAEKKIPLLVVNAYGLHGSFRLQVAEHAIVDAKHDPPIHELRLSRPFQALTEYVAAFELSALSSIEHAHVPFVVVLLKAMDAWKNDHDGAGPSTFSEKMAFKESIQGMAWGGAGHEVNFIEAMDHAYKAYAAPIVPEEVVQVLAAARQRAVTADMSEFWLLARSVADFVDANDGMLPITGVVPDMTASTETYVALQHVYVAQAQRDAQAVAAIVQSHLIAVGRPKDAIADQDIAAFCKNAYNIAMLHTRSIAEELKGVDLSAIDLEDEDTQQSPLIWYVLLRAVGSFVASFQRYPGADASSLEKDLDWLVESAQRLVNGSEMVPWITRDHAMEMTRACEAELHNTAALMGGIASQEAIKIITHQFLPLDHTYIFNGITGHAGTYAV